MHVMIQARVRDVRVNHKLSLKRADLSSSIKKQKKKKKKKETNEENEKHASGKQMRLGLCLPLAC